VLITGGGRGLGKATAEKLAKLGHRVLLAARSPDKAAAAAQEVLGRNAGARVEPCAVELGSLTAIRQFASGWLQREPILDVLFNIAGVMQTRTRRQLSEDGFELTLAVNAFAPFVLTRLLLPALRRSPTSRVVNVSSRMHLPGSRGRPIDFDFDDPNLERGYNPDRAYKNSKLALLWFTYELQRRLGNDRPTVNAVCPGFVPLTALESSHKPFERWLMRHILPHLSFAKSVDEAANDFVFMATDLSIAEVRGRFFGERHEIASSPQSRDVVQAQRFWALASRMTGMPEGVA